MNNNITTITQQVIFFLTFIHHRTLFSSGFKSTANWVSTGGYTKNAFKFIQYRFDHAIHIVQNIIQFRCFYLTEDIFNCLNMLEIL